MRQVLDFTGCNFCGDEETPLENHYGDVLCRECIKIELETDWDQYEADRRQRIAESNEY